MFTQVLHKNRIIHNINFKQKLTGLSAEFSFSLTGCHTNVKDSNQAYNLPIDGGRIVGFLPLPRLLEPCDRQIVSPRQPLYMYI